jgi:hypothetical protein
MLTRHAPPEHPPVPLAITQALPQRPQCAALLATLVSQPFVAFPSQSPKPASHAPSWHAPLAHTPAALGRAHAIAHPPQFAASLRVSTSHPSAAVLLQSLKPDAQPFKMHRPPLHALIALASAHPRLQAPQCVTLVERSCSHPSSRRPLQSPRFIAQLVTQRPAVHEPTAPPSPVHATPHSPQFIASDWRFTQRAPQRAVPAGHAGVASGEALASRGGLGPASVVALASGVEGAASIEGAASARPASRRTGGASAPTAHALAMDAASAVAHRRVVVGSGRSIQGVSHERSAPPI